MNEITEIQNFPIPRIDDILNSLGGSKFFTTLDIKGAFHQIEMEESSRDYTAFTAGNFKYRWARMPMGLSTAPLTWQRAVNTIFCDLIGNGVHVYLDDVIIYGKDRKDHNETLAEVMRLLRKNNLQLKISKCCFYAHEFEYLGHIISEEGMKANPKKIQAVTEYPRPKTVKEIQSFLGMCAYYRRYVKNFAKIAKPLTMLLKKEQPFIWTPSQQEAFSELKKILAEQVTLAFPDFNELFYVTTDASNFAIGGVLSQSLEGKPIYFFSRTLNEAQKRYSTIEKELLAMVETIKEFRVYLYGRYFILVTDHKALCYLFDMKDPGTRLFRQKIDLLEYNFSIIYRSGLQNHVADALSRITPMSIEEMLEEEKTKDIAINAIQTRGLINRENEKSEYFVEERDGTILNRKNYNLVFHLIPIENDELKEKIMNKFGITNFSSKFECFNKIHYYRLISNQYSSRENSDKTLNCIKEILQISKQNNAEKIAINVDYENIRHYFYFLEVFKENFCKSEISVTIFLNKIIELTERDDIEKILELYHNNGLSGHLGRDKCYKTISKFYSWPGMYEDVANYVKKCTICEKNKTFTNTKIPLEISSLGETLFDHCYIDFVGPIKTTSRGNKYIFTAICDLTKVLIAVPTKDSTALTAANCLVDNVLLRFNFPTKIISDNAQAFLSQVIRELTNLFAIKKVFSTKYNPKSNLVERSHRTLGAYLRIYTDKNKDDWDELLKFATFSYNNTVHSTTGFSPYRLCYGREIRIPNSLNKPKLTYNYNNYADKLRNDIAKALELARENLIDRQLKNKARYDEKTKQLDLKIGDMILVKNMTKDHKFDEIYEGPYEVTDVYESYIEYLKNGVRIKINKNFVKKSRAQKDEETE